MKKVLIVLLASFLLFSCSVDQITSVMGKMGQNVMGDYVNTQAVDTAKSNATSAKSTPVNPNPSGKTVLNSITGKGGTAIAVDLGSAGENVSSMLSGLDKDTKDAILDATSSEGGAKNLSESLNATKIEDEKTKEAAKGTATVLSAVLGKMNDEGTASNLNPQAKDAITKLTDNLDKISSGEKVSAADVIALQAVTSLVNELANSATVDSDGTITSVDISSANTTDLITSSLETVTIIQAVNPANVISSDDLETLIKALTKSDDSTRAITVDNKSAEAIRNLYSLYTKLFKDGISASKVSVMSLYSGSVDMYVGLANKKADKLSGEIVDLDRIVQYVVSAFFSTAEHSYSELAEKAFDGVYPTTLDAYIEKLVEKNEWIKDPKQEAKKLDIELGITLKADANNKDIINGILGKMVSTGNTIAVLCNKLNLTKLGIEQSTIDQIPDFFKTGIDYEWK